MRNCDNCLRITLHANSCPMEENSWCYEANGQPGHSDVLWPALKCKKPPFMAPMK